MPSVDPANKPTLALDHTGWLRPQQNVSHAPSPNFNERPADCETDLLVIHNISLPPNIFNGTAIIEFFQNKLDLNSHPWFENLRGLHVSAHFLIRRDGHIVQFVSTDDRAWHAGQSHYCGRSQCNDFSIGIELEGSDYVPFEAAQYHSLSLLSQAIMQRHPLRGICGHEHIAPERKTDPGPFFDWQRYANDTGLPTTLFLPLQQT